MRSTAEQQEARRKEKEKKLQIYRSTVANIFEKVSHFCFIPENVEVIVFVRICCIFGTIIFAVILLRL